MRILVTGHAGFIGFHVADALLGEGHQVHGLDCVNDYYDVNLKLRRLALLQERPGFSETRASLEDHEGLLALFARFRPEVVIHLAAQAGVRYSVENPRAYLGSNMVGSFNLLEACGLFPVQHLLLASTSSAYGANEKFPFEETDRAVHPITLYAASKGAMELMAHSYAHLFCTPTTAFRSSRSMAPGAGRTWRIFLFTRAILEGRPIQLFNHGESWRDFTFINDLVTSIRRLMDCVPPAASAREGLAQLPGDSLSPVAPYRLVNIGAGRPEKVTSLVDALEQALGVAAKARVEAAPAGRCGEDLRQCRSSLRTHGAAPLHAAS